MIGIGSDCLVKKLDIKGFSWFDKILIRIIIWYFKKRNTSVTFHKPRIKSNYPNCKLIIKSSGNLGINA